MAVISLIGKNLRVSMLLVIGLCAGSSCSIAQTKKDKPSANASTTSASDISPAKAKKAKEFLDAAMNHFNLGERDKALQMVNKSIATNPMVADAYSLQAMLYDDKGDTTSARKSYENCIAVAPLYRPSYYYFAEYQFRKKQFGQALALLDSFDVLPKKVGYVESKHKASPKLMEKALRLRGIVISAQEDQLIGVSIKLENAGNVINTSLNEYWPGMPFNGKTFVFTRLMPSPTGLQEDFYYSEIKQNGVQGTGGFVEAKPVPGNINTPNNEGTLSISADGKSLYYSRCNQPGDSGSCDIYVSTLTDRGWEYGSNVGAPINSKSWESQPSVSGDGHTLVFSSNRYGGYGGKDLWMSTLKNGVWSKPINLGASINTVGNEESPFLHYDGQTLYFSSTGLPGYGGIDMFMSRQQPNGGWSTPINLGNIINSQDDDFGMYIDPWGKGGFIQSDRKGGFGGLDIYRFNLPEKFKPKAVTYVQGRVIDKSTRKPVRGLVELVDLSINKVVFSDSIESFFIPLHAGGNYAMHVRAQGYKFDSRNFQPKDTGLKNPFVIISELEPFKENDIIVLKNIFFDTDKFELKSESISEIQVLEGILKSNPTMVLEVRGHTDNQGNEAHNMELSKNRATALVQALVARGISEKRFVAKGFGASLPMADNSTELGRAMNRRTEIKVLRK
jgi:outer membrane protein OmpA-like peptidoglycan-associated protein